MSQTWEEDQSTGAREPSGSRLMEIFGLRKALALLRLSAAGALAFSLAVVPTAHGKAGGCAHADASGGTASARTLRAATLCLLNSERRERGLAALRRDLRLSTAAARHARDMVQRHYFSHDSPEGRGVLDRVLRSGYRSERGLIVGENLAWAQAARSTPRSVVRMWMASPGHRRNVLSRGWRDAGIAIIGGVPPRERGGGLTYVADFGKREA
jgi:uncharacterized protein YkwD